MRTLQATLAATVWFAATVATTPSVTPAHADPAAGGCDPHTLAVAASAGQPGLGHRAVLLNFTLQPGAAACQLTGYPTVDAQIEGAAPIHAAQTPGGYLGGATPGVTVTLQPGRGTHAMLEWVAAGDNHCQIYGPAGAHGNLIVTPPGTAQSFTVPISVGRNEGLCTLQVHPVTGD